MFLRPLQVLAIAFFAFAPISALAGEPSAYLTIEAKALKSAKGKLVQTLLAEHLEVHTQADAMKLWVVGVQNGEVTRLHESDTLMLRKRPGRLKYNEKTEFASEMKSDWSKGITLEVLPEAEFFNGLHLNGFEVPALNELLIGPKTSQSQIEEIALKVFETSGHKEGIFIVTTWDDMVKGDSSRGLVGFGSWN